MIALGQGRLRRLAVLLAQRRQVLLDVGEDRLDPKRPLGVGIGRGRPESGHGRNADLDQLPLRVLASEMVRVSELLNQQADTVGRVRLPVRRLRRACGSPYRGRA